MKVYVILESFTDFKGGNATSYGVFKSKEDAVKAMPKAIFQGTNIVGEEEFEETYGNNFNSLYKDNCRDHWIIDLGDSLLEYYIQEDELM